MNEFVRVMALEMYRNVKEGLEETLKIHKEKGLDTADIEESLRQVNINYDKLVANNG